ncbi:hypothetical protein G5V58_25460 [Nocardioides anomalus]|uniref:Uncharacterized protein n=1 Tax=Nocardioides anomalus TaxID=2712223 RepID=A0A6G6WJX9_9ACTN|nr:hypothetical protein [Nocardioides anomalus]QIG45641.1 hypothetical protein G5V58_25460 [Nocardioides anomalus]
MHLSRAARIAALTTTSALAAATLVAMAPAAQAAVITGTTMVGLGSTKDAACTDSAADTSPDQTVPLAADGAAKTASLSYANTVTKAGSPGEVTTVTASATSTVTATQAAGQLSQVVIDTSYSASVNAALGAAQTCKVSANIGGQTTYQFDLVAPAYVTVTTEARGGVVQSITANSLSSLSTVRLVGNFVGGPHSVGTASALLPAGVNYITQYVHQDQVDAASPTNTRTSTTGSAKTTITLQTPGIAQGAATGDGGKYLTLAAGRDCTAGTLAGTWTKAVGKGKKSKIKKAQFFVNGTQVATVKKPKKATTTTLTGLDPSKAAAVEVKLTLVKKKPAKKHHAHRADKPTKGGGTATVEQSYLPCS